MNTKAPTLECTMTNGRNVTITKEDVSEVVEKDDGSCIVRMVGGSFYHLIDQYEYVSGWFVDRT